MISLRDLLGILLIVPSLCFAASSSSSSMPGFPSMQGFPSGSMGQTGKGKSQQKNASPFQHNQPGAKQEEGRRQRHINSAEENMPIKGAPAGTKYLGHPGILANRGGEWLWSDDLLNLPKNISISVEIAKPDDVDLNLDIDKLESVIADVLKKYNISQGAVTDPGFPDLPNFHVLVMIYPIKDGYTFATIASLLEPVTLPRVKLDEGVTMQAITWDRDSIHIVPKTEFNKELENTLKDTANAFGERFAFFDRMRSEENKPSL